jgi:hypothetical protein
MQIMFGHPSLSLTFSWAAPAQEGLMPNPSLSSPSGSSTDGDAPLDEAELLGKPFELTLTRQVLSRSLKHHHHESWGWGCLLQKYPAIAHFIAIAQTVIPVWAISLTINIFWTLDVAFGSSRMSRFSNLQEWQWLDPDLLGACKHAQSPLGWVNWPEVGIACRFLAGGTNDAEANKRRDGTLKLIPRISQGAWFVKQAVGTTPCLLGRKLTASYHRLLSPSPLTD